MSEPAPWWRVWAPSIFRTLLIPLCAGIYLGITAWQNYVLERAQPVFPEFNLPQVGAVNVQLSKATTLSGPRLVVFWATWCAPCQKQREILDPWISLGRREQQVLGIATLDAPDQVAAAEAAHPHPFASVLDRDGQIADVLGIQALPVSLLVNENGRVTRRFTGPLTAADLQIIAQQLK